MPVAGALPQREVARVALGAADIASTRIPRDARDVCEVWCQSELAPIWGGSLRQVRVVPMPEGRMSATVRIALDWSAGQGPSTLVVKLASQSRRARKVAMQEDAYATEYRFYTELARDLPVAVPRCHAAAFDASTGAYCLVLEDMATAQAPMPDPFSLDRRAASQAIGALARLHCYRPALGPGRLRWLARREPIIASAQGVALALALASRFLELPLPDDSVVRACERLRHSAPHGDNPAAPFVSVVHGDFRTENLIWAQDRMTILDWQTVGLGPGLADLAYFVGTSVSDEARNGRHDELLDEYLDAAAEAGVATDPLAARRAYRQYVFAGLILAIIGWRVTEHDAKADALFATLATRSARHALEVLG
jgi:aminoglycoside phosphotransferase (APT) family kinase protein